MEENGGGSKVMKIKQIVRLKELINKWQSATLGNNRCGGRGGISPAIINRLKSSDINSNFGRGGGAGGADSDEESSCNSPEPTPSDVPKGYLAVYVGLSGSTNSNTTSDDDNNNNNGEDEDQRRQQHRRFIIPTSYLSNPLFKLLLEKVEEEFGFDLTGGLTIPCEIETFKYLLQCIESQQHLKKHQLAAVNTNAGDANDGDHDHDLDDHNNNSDGRSVALEECKGRIGD